MKIYNYMEQIVWHYLNELLQQQHEICHCDRCRLDMAAIALNHLPRRYTVNHRGEVYSKLNSLDQQCQVDVLAALTQAMHVVTARPHHEDTRR